ncbi:MAG: hypothetical protein NC114_10855 [Ruminococcus flavefaciens]|nr:hypothetical protein [Ruminococcus flavefaciens]
MATWTPWGTADYIDTVTRGIAFCGTPGHGGYRVSIRKYEAACQRRNLPIGHYTARDKTYYWFEEDCEWGFVALAFPEYFQHRNGIMEAARRVISDCWPEYPVAA